METKIKEQAELNAALYEERFRKVAKVAFEEGAEWAQSHSGWIKVEDREPETFDTVLVYDDRHGVLIADYDPSWGFCSYEHGNLEHVTHWMPIVLPD